jgi:hypothetical protein
MYHTYHLDTEARRLINDGVLSIGIDDYERLSARKSDNTKMLLATRANTLGGPRLDNAAERYVTLLALVE